MTDDSNAPPIVAVVGWKNSGKTTLAVRLIAAFAGMGLRVASIKHAHHKFHIDEGHQDSARHRKAGAAEVAVISPERWAMISETPGDERPEPDFAEVVSWFGPADIIVVEGYKSQPVPKIEARRRNGRSDRPMAPHDPHIIAIAADHAVADTDVATFNLNAIDEIVVFLIKRLAIRSGEVED